MGLTLLPKRAAQGVLVLVGLAGAALALAHGGGNWDPFTIDGVNDNARGRVVEVQGLVAEIVRGRSDEEWPPTTFTQLRDTLITAREEADEVLEHYVNDGTNIQSPAVLHADPRAGRTVAASGALGAAIALLDHAASLASADDFVAEFYAGAMAARLYELIDVQRDRMDVYALLTQASEAQTE